MEEGEFMVAEHFFFLFFSKPSIFFRGTIPLSELEKRSDANIL